MNILPFEENGSNRIRDSMKTFFNIESLLRNNQKVVTNGYPYLCVNCVLASSVKGIDVKVLLYPFEKQLNLPSFTIKFRNSERLQGKIVGQETIENPCCKIFIHNKSKVIRILSDSHITSKPNAHYVLHLS